MRWLHRLVLPAVAIGAAPQLADAAPAPALDRYAIRTLPVPDGVDVRSATYTPSGKVLLTLARQGVNDPRAVTLATINDDGTAFRPFFTGRLPDRPRDNGLRWMVFPDDRRVFTGDFVIECRQPLERCRDPLVIPVIYPPDVADGAHIGARWSEIIVAPDNRHIAWTTLLAGYTAAAVLTGELRRHGTSYVIARPRIISTIDAFKPDPAHLDGVIPQVVRGGEVKQFVAGGTAISLVGSVKRDLPNSAVQDLANGNLEAITDTPGYTETTIFSPDERLGLTMTTRFSPTTDLAVLGLVPRPWPASLNMGLSMFAYTFGVTGVRKGREGNIGPALIDIAASARQPGYLGVNLSTSPDWVFGSPMSWHPSGRKGMWMEFQRGTGKRRVQLVELADYRPASRVRTRQTPDAMPYASSDLSVIPSLVGRSQDIDVKVYGRSSGTITYRRAAGRIEKVYAGYSDDGRTVWSGRETTEFRPEGNSTYSAKLALSGEHVGAMDLMLTFGPLMGAMPARIMFEPDASGAPQTRGYAEYDGKSWMYQLYHLEIS